MSKVTVVLKNKYTIGGDELSGEIEIDKPTVGTMIDAGELCSPQNQVGFGVAILAVTLKVPFNQIREMDTKAFMSLQEELKEILPN